MYDWSVIAVLGAIAILAIFVLILIVTVGRFVWAIASAHRDHKRKEARRVTGTVPSLGEFTTTDNQFWFGEVRGIYITLDSPNSAPGESHAKQVHALLDQLPALAEKATKFLAAHEDISWLTGGAGEFEPYGIDPQAEGVFVIEMTHPADVDGVYRVEFRDGIPVSSGRDD